jgi:hypothetical protein
VIHTHSEEERKTNRGREWESKTERQLEKVSGRGREKIKKE